MQCREKRLKSDFMLLWQFCFVKLTVYSAKDDDIDPGKLKAVIKSSVSYFLVY